MSSLVPGPIVEEVLRFEDVRLGSLGTRRAVVHWTDKPGPVTSEAITWYADEVLICEGRSHRKDSRTAAVLGLPQRP